MLAFVVRRLIIGVLILFASSFLVFVMVANSGDPLAHLRSRQPPPSPAVIAAEENRLHLNESIPVRYGYWLAGAVRGDFGEMVNGKPVGPELMLRFGITLRMVIAAILLAMLLALITGVVAAVRQYKLSDYFITLMGFVFISIPSFWMAGLLKDLALRFNDATDSQTFKFFGEESSRLSGNSWSLLQDRFSHLILPTISLALISYAAWSRYQRASMLEVLDSDYLRLARAKGLPWRKAIIRHGMRNALIPITTVVALDFGVIIGGAVITEIVFSWHGMGRLLQQAVSFSDSNLLLGWLMVTATAVIVLNLVADIVYAYLDPRIRLG